MSHLQLEWASHLEHLDVPSLDEPNQACIEAILRYHFRNKNLIVGISCKNGLELKFPLINKNTLAFYMKVNLPTFGYIEYISAIGTLCLLCNWEYNLMENNFLRRMSS